MGIEIEALEHAMESRTAKIISFALGACLVMALVGVAVTHHRVKPNFQLPAATSSLAASENDVTLHFNTEVIGASHRFVYCLEVTAKTHADAEAQLSKVKKCSFFFWNCETALSNEVLSTGPCSCSPSPCSQFCNLPQRDRGTASRR